MVEKIFAASFLDRLALTIGEVEREKPESTDTEPLDAQDTEAIYSAYQERGGDAAAAKRQLAAAREKCDQALGRILQFISDQYGSGAIEKLSDETLKDLARDGVDAMRNWAACVKSQNALAPRLSPLGHLLEAHHQLEETHLDLHDEILWPVAKRISRVDRRKPPRHP